MFRRKEKCKDCGKRFPKEKMKYIGKVALCEECYEKRIHPQKLKKLKSTVEKKISERKEEEIKEKEKIKEEVPKIPKVYTLEDIVIRLDAIIEGIALLNKILGSLEKGNEKSEQ